MRPIDGQSARLSAHTARHFNITIPEHQFLPSTTQIQVTPDSLYTHPMPIPHIILALLPLLLTACTTTTRTASPPEPHGAIPTPQQLAWHDHRFYAFVHFNMNTFTAVEWGDGREHPDTFNPTDLDTDQWCRIFSESGLTGVIITAKHHDGFCLWPSDYTDHDVAASSWRNGNGDVIRELAESCQKYGLWLGVYISPWDQNHPDYGRNDHAYNDFFNNQLTELLTNYGPIAEVWWDGANGDRNNPEKHQDYDWPRFINTVNTLQPDAVIFAPPNANVPGGIRWVGNEAGHANPTQWSTHPQGIEEDPATLNTGVEGAPTWFPAETDVSIRQGWYWSPDSDNTVKSSTKLVDIYHDSVGHNTNLLLNFAIDNRGQLHPAEVLAIKSTAYELKRMYELDIANTYTGTTATASTTRGQPFTAQALIDNNDSTYWAAPDNQTKATITIEFAQPETINAAILQEHIELGQRIRAWNLQARIDAQWITIFEATTIGHHRIARFNPITTDTIRLNITDANAPPTLERLSLYLTNTYKPN